MKPIRIMVLTVMLVGLATVGSAQTSSFLQEIENAFVDIGQRIRPTVVNIDVERSRGEGNGDSLEGLEDLFRYFGRPMPRERDPRIPEPQQRAPMSLGAGFIYDSSGHIVTNSHVVKDAQSIRVRLWNGDEYNAEVIGADPQSDIAVIKIDPRGNELPVANLGDSEELNVGQFAIAVGSPHSLEGSLSFGHITALGRDSRTIRLPDIQFFDFIQTDAAINLGNSGGPLCNINGDVIGMNVAIVWRADALGFAIPVNRIKHVAPLLITEGRVRRGFLGVGIEDARKVADAVDLPDMKGALVEQVGTGSPAEKAGVQVYDIIREVNGQTVDNASDLQNKISKLPPDDVAILTLWRDGEHIEVEVMLAERPDDGLRALLGPPLLGMQVDTAEEIHLRNVGLDPDTPGVVVISIEPGSPAADADLRPGDVIIEVAKETVGSPSEFRRRVQENAQPGRSLLLRIAREGVSSPMIMTVRIPEDGLGN